MNSPLPRKYRAFTLIELLIVVAIISILAGIALPNLLEAQVRAKISRAKADMRAAATALEAYCADQGCYAPPIAYLGSGPYEIEDPSEDEYQAFLPMRLTTPVAYMTSLPTDPFTAKTASEHPPHAAYHYSEQHNNAAMDPPMEAFIGDRLRSMGQAAGSSCPYLLGSHGPDQADPGDKPAAYDPTNGTISAGDIFFTAGGGK